MVFTTIEFLVFFLVVFLVYYLLAYLPFTKGRGLQKWWLLAANLFFYGWASPVYLLFLGGSSLCVYTASVLIGKQEEKLAARIASLPKAERKAARAEGTRQKRVVLVFAVLLTLLLLILPKYTNFLLQNINGILHVFRKDPLPGVSWVLPLGLSFYTFQNIGYLANVYWGEYPPERNFFRYLLYISYFPHVLQGPLEEYEEIAPQLYAEHTFDSVRAERGLLRLLFGLFKKWVIATQLSVILSPYLSGEQEAFGWLVVLIAVGYAIELYADFSGYMDMAIGCSEMLGIRMAENFRTPYFSGSIAEYWRRWHITLGAWFKNYVFYPLLRSKALTKLRKRLGAHKYLASVLPTAISLLVVWLLIGFWHGADWSYVLHGLYHGCFVISASVLEPLYRWLEGKFPRLAKSKAFGLFRIVRTFCIVCFGYLLFAPGNLSLTASWLANLFRFEGTQEVFSALWHEKAYSFVSAALGTVVLFFVDLRSLGAKGGKDRPALRVLWYLLLGVGILLFGAYSEADASQFLYFPF